MSLNSCGGETKRDTKKDKQKRTSFDKTASRTDDDDELQKKLERSSNALFSPRARSCVLFFVLRGRRERESDLVFSRRKNVEIDTRTSRGG